MSVKANNLEQQAQEVWNTSDIDCKKILLHRMIDGFKFKAKQEMFRDLVVVTNKAVRLDKLAADLMLADTDKVVTFLKR